jgi:glycosyltransferase involved in cell wall biosynthesis
MRLLHIQKVKGIGGAERHLLGLLPALTARGIQVRMCVLGSQDYQRFVKPLTASGVETTVVNVERLRPPRLVWDLYMEIRRYRPHLVHTHLIHADVYGQIAARAARVPAVSSCHNTHAFYRRQPYLAAARASGHMARRVIAISNHVARFIAALHLARRDAVRVIPYGIDCAAWSLDDRRRSFARTALNLTDVTTVVGVASRLIPGKGHKVLFDALRLVFDEAPALSLVIAGDGPLRSDLESEARDFPEGSVRFLGYVDDMPSLLHACDIVVFPTQPDLSEGFGLAALEAMAAGRPVIVTDVGPLPELVDEGKAGIIVPAKSAEELAEALMRLARDGDLRDRLGECGRRLAATKYSLEAMVDRTLDLYWELL